MKNGSRAACFHIFYGTNKGEAGGQLSCSRIVAAIACKSAGV
jgi:hypothetical protein